VNEDAARIRSLEIELDYWRSLVGALRKAAETPRGGVLAEATDLITGDRNNQYGEPTQDFDRTAGLWNAAGYRGPVGRDVLLNHDVALMIALLKISRLMWQPGKRDSWVDLAGYAACGYECTVAGEGVQNLPD
jgi:Domain of unknown function (DUF6378)